MSKVSNTLFKFVSTSFAGPRLIAYTHLEIQRSSADRLHVTIQLGAHDFSLGYLHDLPAR